MNQGLIPQRYARALYKVAQERGCSDALYRLCVTLSQQFATEPGLQKAMENPYVSYDKKLSLALVAASIGDVTANDSATATFTDFVKLVHNNRRIPFLREAVLSFMAIYRKERNISTVTVTSASKLDDSDTKRLLDIIKVHHPHGSIEYNEVVDPDLIGGFTIAIDNTRLDASIKNELKQLRLKLLSN